MAQFLYENDNFFRQRFIVRERPGHASNRYHNIQAASSTFSVSSTGGDGKQFAPEGIPLPRFSLKFQRSAKREEQVEKELCDISPRQILLNTVLMEIISIIMVTAMNMVSRACARFQQHGTCYTHVLSQIKDYCH